MKLLLSIVLLLIAQVSFGQEAMNTHAELYSRNKVSTMRSSEHRYRNEKVKGRGKKFDREVYDSLGRVVEESVFGGGESLKYYSYNERGEVCEEKYHFMKWDSSPLIKHLFYQYDSLQRLINKKDNESYGDEWQYSYDAAGRLICTKWYYSGPNSFFIDSFYYAGNLLTRKSRFHSDGAPYFQMVYQYDSDGNLTREDRYQYGEITFTWIRKYDSFGNITELITQDSKGRIESHTRYSYNERGLLSGMYITDFINKRESRCFVYVYEYYP